MQNFELYWEIVMNISAAVTIALMGWFLQRFVNPFLPGCRKRNLIGFSYIAIMLLLRFSPNFVISSMTAYAIGIAGAFMVMRYLHAGNVEQKIFLSVTFFLLQWIAQGSTVVPWAALFDVLIYPAPIAKQPWLQLWLYITIEIVSILLETTVMYLLIRLVHRAYVFKRENITKKELMLILTPSFLAAAGWFVFINFNQIYEADTNLNIYFTHREYNWILLLYQVLSFAALFAVIIIDQSMKDSQRKEKEDAVLLHQMEDMERHIREAENLYDEIRSIKHDMRNHVMTLEKLCGQREEAIQYARELKVHVDEVAVEIKSGNPVTDVILLEKQKEAKEKGISFEHDFHYPPEGNSNAFDISVILNNALNNAIEAAAECENPYIAISSYMRRNAYMIEVRNSVLGERILDEERGLPITTKKEGEHGFGLANIRKVAQKYYGDIDICQNGNEFGLCVMLMIHND